MALSVHPSGAHIAVVGAGITGVTTAYALSRLGYRVTVIDRHRYPAMETSFANGGQLSACHAEAWNSRATVLRGLKWMLKNDAPLLLKPAPSWHKYSWLGEFLGHIRHYRSTTIETTRLAIAARAHLYAIAERENIAFDLERRGILHLYHDAPSFAAAAKANALLRSGGLERHAVTPEEIRALEPALRGRYHGGYFTPSDATGDIHKFTRGLARACERDGVRFMLEADVTTMDAGIGGVRLCMASAVVSGAANGGAAAPPAQLHADAVVVCAGVASRHFAAMLGDRLNIYPVKGYSVTVHLDDPASVAQAPWVSLIDESVKIVASRLGAERFRVAGTAEFNGYNRDIRADRIAPLLAWTRRTVDIGTARVVPWAGLRPMMPGMLPRVGRGSMRGVYYNTGHGHLGWTLSMATAELLAQTVAADN
jgi:D-amino-acid dehydrogenase